jgi:hypothetical protein
MAEKKVSKTINEDGTLTFEFATGETENVNPSDFTPEIQAQLTLHGASQKLGDSYSGEDADKCHAVFVGVLKNLTEGNWSARSGGGGAPRVSQLAEALARETGKTVEECVEKLSGLDDDKKKAVRAHPAIQARLAEIKLEKAQAQAEQMKKDLADGGDVPSLSF